MSRYNNDNSLRNNLEATKRIVEICRLAIEAVTKDRVKDGKSIFAPGALGRVKKLAEEMARSEENPEQIGEELEI